MTDIFGTPEDDTLNGTSDDDTITTLSGDDTVNAGAGDDLITIDADGTGFIDGGDGFDLVTIDNRSTGLFIDPNSDVPVISIFNNAGSYTAENVEEIEVFDGTELITLGRLGTNNSDIIDVSNAIVQVSIGGGAGNDTLTGGAASDSLTGGPGDDILIGNAGLNRLDGGAGADQLIGGNQDDFAWYRFSNASVTVDLETGVALGGHAEGDTFVSIEDLRGSFFDDNLSGNSEDNLIAGDTGNDILNGRAGNDRLAGGSGDDTIEGGQGADILFGEAGEDVFLISSLSEANGDTIEDFDSGDSIVFTAAATFVGASAFSGNGGAEIRAIETGGTTLVQYDADGNGTTDGTLTIANGEFELSDINAGGAVTLAVDDTITGTSGDDTLTGTVNDDVINGLGGDDIITLSLIHI